MARGKKYWLMKSEPDVFSIEDLERAGTEPWDGIRNYQARNFMRDDMKKGDEVLFYHSRAKPPGVAGLARVCREAYPDHTARDPKSKYHDPRATKENPIWMMVDLEFVEQFPSLIALDELRNAPGFDGLLVIKKGQRLSIQPVDAAHFRKIVKMGRGKAAGT